ncbi:MAG: plasmid pRiA4b ORF-3 family protein [Planctomycetes bacterium]|jgi:hypothetical protein|nr:plasmid pRiA4b ORF-3 family protein [Phycisphaerae bacterium]NBB96468.1 plasmid pRiA4b ORF-3 family protein [Planctomycetota bacterium]
MAKKTQRIYQIRVTLNGSKPPIWRELAVPFHIVLGELHEVIQVAMGWEDCHMHQFRKGKEYYVTKVTPWGMPVEIEGEDEEDFTLGEVCPKARSKLLYEYDFGDGWAHTIEAQKRIEPEPGVKYPVCLGGEKACPPEDCGGMWGYSEMLDVLADPDADDPNDMREWIGDEFDPDAFDLDAVNAILATW